MICPWRSWGGVDTRSDPESSKLALRVVSKRGALSIRDIDSVSMKVSQGGGWFPVKSDADVAVRWDSSGSFQEWGEEEDGWLQRHGTEFRWGGPGRFSPGVALLQPSEKCTRRPRLPPGNWAGSAGQGAGFEVRV